MEHVKIERKLPTDGRKPRVFQNKILASSESTKTMFKDEIGEIVWFDIIKRKTAQEE